MTITVAPAIGPELLDVTARRAARLLVHPTVIGLHNAFRQVVSEARGLDLTSDSGHQVAVGLADELLEALAEHLVFRGQHPYADPRKTVAGWLASATLSQIRDELAAAASWWAAELTPGRLL